MADKIKHRPPKFQWRRVQPFDADDYILIEEIGVGEFCRVPEEYGPAAEKIVNALNARTRQDAFRELGG